MKGKVIGIGGIFLKFKDPEKMIKWHSQVLDIITNDYGVLFAFNHSCKERNFLQLGTFPIGTDYFGSNEQLSMLNFRVDDLSLILVRLKKYKVTILDKIETYDY